MNRSANTVAHRGEEATMKVLIADDNPVIRAGMVAMLSDLDGVDEVLTAADGVQALQRCREHHPQALFLDVRMPFKSGLDVLAELDGDIAVVMLTHSDAPDLVREALRRGARGYLVHGNFAESDLIAALRVCAHGGLLVGPGVADALLGSVTAAPPAVSGPPAQLSSQLTTREQEIMRSIARGLSNAQIARELFLSEKTVKNHLNRINVKLGFRSRAEAVAAWHGVASVSGGST
jgi:DNA-binding NarL/FixJ family response regulator